VELIEHAGPELTAPSAVRHAGLTEKKRLVAGDHMTLATVTSELPPASSVVTVIVAASGGRKLEHARPGWEHRSDQPTAPVNYPRSPV
jgi:hypothetical protein